MALSSDVKLRIYNVAATVFNMRPFTKDDIEGEDDANPNLAAFNTLLEPALYMAMREYDWSFLQSLLDIGDDLGAVGNYRHSYKLPDGLFRLCHVACGTLYRRVGDKLLTNQPEKPSAYGIIEDFDEESAPKDFWDLIGYALAFMASNSVSAGDSKANTAMGLYQKLAQNMIINDAQNGSRTLVDTGEFRWRM